MIPTLEPELQTLRAGGWSFEPPVRQAIGVLAEEIRSRVNQASPSSADFLRAALDALAQIKGVAEVETRVGCFLDIAQYFYLLGQPFQAIGPTTKALELATQTDQRQLIIRGSSVLGVIYADTGNISGAIECYARALEYLSAERDTAAECKVWINLGVALMYAAQYGDAIACFEHAIEIAKDAPELANFRPMAYANIALCCLHLEDYGKGLKAAETSVRESAEPRNAGEMLSRVIREANFVRLLLEVSNVAKAAERCEIAKRYAVRSKSARAELLASTIEGLCEVYAGNVDVGISRLTATLEKARILRSALRETLMALVKAFEIVGQPQRALIYLREMMEANRNVQQENSLTHVRLHLEHLGSANQDEVAAKVKLERQEALLKGQVAEQELFRSRVEMLERLAVTAELRDDSTGEHSYRVGKLAALLAQEYGCDDGTCFMVELAARLHDIGKIGVPDAILLKPDKLNEAELAVMRTHTMVGAELLSKSNIPHMQMAEEIARNHHEWWDGSGYPSTLSGSAIPLAARITALADVFDALTHKRPYKQAWPIDKALDEIARLKGKQFDPQLTDCFLVLVERLRAEHADLDAYLGQAALSSPFLQARTRIWSALRHGKEFEEAHSGTRRDVQR